MSRKKRAFTPAVGTPAAPAVGAPEMGATVDELTAVKSPFLGSTAVLPAADVVASFGSDGTESYPDAGVPQIDPMTGQPLSRFAQLMVSGVTDNDTRAWSQLLGQPMDRLSTAKLNYAMVSTAVLSGGAGLVLGLGLGALGMALWTKFHKPPSPVEYIPVETARNWTRGVKIH